MEEAFQLSISCIFCQKNARCLK